MSRRTFIASAILLGILLVGLFDYAIVRYGVEHQAQPTHNHNISNRFFESLRADFIHQFGCHGLGKVFCELFDTSVQKNTTVKHYHQALLSEIQQGLQQCLKQQQQQGKIDEKCQFLIHYRYTDKNDHQQIYSIEDAYRLSYEYNNSQQELSATLKVIEQLK